MINLWISESLYSTFFEACRARKKRTDSSSKLFNFRALVAIVLAAGLTACGGGGGGGSTTATASSNSVSPSASASGPDTLADSNTYSSSDTLLISGLSPTNYELDVFDKGTRWFIDREYTFSDVPAEYAGMVYVRTAKFDSTSSGNNLISFDVNVPVTVYVAHTDTINNKPGWLASWNDTGDNMVNRSIFKKDFPAGSVVLGGNTYDGTQIGSMYLVFLAPQGWTNNSENSGSINIIPDSSSGNNTTENSTANSDGSSGGAAASISLTLTWDPVPGASYLVYFDKGLVLDPAPVSSFISSTSATFDGQNDLGLSSGDYACFWVQSVNIGGISELSNPVCGIV